MIEVNNVVKIVITFTSTRTKTQITNFLKNTIWSKLQTKINTVMNNNFDVGWKVEPKLKVIELGVNKWQVYPKFAISGTTNLTGQQLKTGVSNLLANLKTTLLAEVNSQNASNISFHVHYSDGRALAGDES